MNDEKRIRKFIKKFKVAYNRAMNNFYEIVDIIDFSGFGEDHPEILTLSNGTIIVTCDDVDVDLEDVIPYLNEYNELTKESWDKILSKFFQLEN